MTNVKIEKKGNGYFLIIHDEVAPEVINHTWAVTEEELLELKRLLNEMFK